MRSILRVTATIVKKITNIVGAEYLDQPMIFAFAFFERFEFVSA